MYFQAPKKEKEGMRLTRSFKEGREVKQERGGVAGHFSPPAASARAKKEEEEEEERNALLFLLGRSV